jgi:hypothetical protein
LLIRKKIEFVKYFLVALAFGPDDAEDFLSHSPERVTSSQRSSQFGSQVGTIFRSPESESKRRKVTGNCC